MKEELYENLARRTDGDIYIGVVGPVRVGKSTFVKRVMEEVVIPNMTDASDRIRAQDELPQSSPGPVIMTSEPKFVPAQGTIGCNWRWRIKISNTTSRLCGLCH